MVLEFEEGCSKGGGAFAGEFWFDLVLFVTTPSLSARIGAPSTSPPILAETNAIGS